MILNALHYQARLQIQKNIDEIHRIVLKYRKVKGLDALKISTAHVRGILYENLYVRVLFEATVCDNGRDIDTLKT